jgi:hypothetical protein
VGLATPGVAEDAGELIGLPPLNLLVVALPGASLRLVAGPVQSAAEQAADVVGVVLDAEVLADEKRDAGGGPQFIGEAVGGCPLLQECFQCLQLGVSQSASGTRGRFSSKPRVVACHPPPAVQGGGSDAEDACDDGGGFALLEQLDSPESPSF